MAQRCSPIVGAVLLSASVAMCQLINSELRELLATLSSELAVEARPEVQARQQLADVCRHAPISTISSDHPGRV